MKRLILILLLFPFVAIGQTYEDIISIDSKEQFIRIGAENGYEVMENNGNSVKLALDPTYEENEVVGAKAFAEFGTGGNSIAVVFTFWKENLWTKKSYDDIFSIVKEKHKFLEIFENITYYAVNEKTEIGFKIEKGWCNVVIGKKN